MNDMDYEDDSDAMMDEDSADEYGVLTEAGFSEDQADAIVSAIRLCQSKGESSEPEPSSKKGKAGSDALALLIGMGPKKGK
jgi:hypothetical protein